MDFLSKAKQKDYAKLKQKKYRDQFGLFLIEGIKGVQEVLDSFFQIETILIDETKKDDDRMISLIYWAQEKNIPLHVLDAIAIDRIKTTQQFPGIAAVVHKQAHSFDSVDSNKAIICLEDIQDPGNLGTIIRSADWFGIDQIILSAKSVDPYNDKVIRASMGSFFRVRCMQEKSIPFHKHLASLKTMGGVGYECIGLALDGNAFNQQAIQSIQTSENIPAFIFGSESHGISTEVNALLDTKLRINGIGQAESLNVAVAASITLSLWRFDFD